MWFHDCNQNIHELTDKNIILMETQLHQKKNIPEKTMSKEPTFDAIPTLNMQMQMPFAFMVII